METTGKAFIEHWNWAAEKGVMNKNTAGGLRTACAQVLSVLDDPDSVDIKTLDVEETLIRFQNLKKKDFKPAVLETYKRRFRHAVTSYFKYLKDPGGWKPRILERNGATEGSKEADRPIKASSTSRNEMPQTGFVEYPFPLRKDQNARLVLPRDLKMSEVKRLSTFMSSLAIDSAE